MIKHLLFLIVTLIAYTQAFCYPITHQTLRMLIEQSEYIVFGKVDNPPKPNEVTSQKGENGSMVSTFYFDDDGNANLLITELLKGDLHGAKKIKVEYIANMVCPAPARYDDGDFVLAFLYKDKKAKCYGTVGLSYGSKSVVNKEMEIIYKKRILEYLAVLKINNKVLKKDETIEWLINCLDNKFTSNDAAADLGRNGDLRPYYNNFNEDFISKNITPNQIAKIENAFFIIDTLQYGDLYLINYISKSKYDLLQKHLFNNLNTDENYLAKDIMGIFLIMIPNVALEFAIKKFIDIDYDDKEREIKEKQVILEFKNLLQKILFETKV